MTARKRASWIIANWKMNLSESESVAPLSALLAGASRLAESIRIAVAPSFPCLRAVSDRLSGTPISLAAQNVHWEDRGAFTGEVSPRMLVELGVRLVLVGHSERRHLFGETDQQIASKAAACLRHGLVPVICVGETETERESSRTAEVILRQLGAALAAMGSTPGEFLLAYEPVWAIGTGRNATSAQAQEAQALLRGLLREQLGAARGEAVPIVYGGSVTAENAGGLLAMEDVDGALVGGASLKPESLLAIAGAAPA